MSHNMTTGMLAQTLAPMLSPIVLVALDSAAGTLYVWNGIGTLVWNGNPFIGVGEFGSVDSISETSAIQSNGATLSLSGIPSSLISMAVESMQRFLPCKIWIGALDSNGAVVASPYLIRNGRVDTAAIEDDGTTATIQVTIESRLMTMFTAKSRRYTDQDQKIERPWDNGFKFVDQLQNASVNWGSFII